MMSDNIIGKARRLWASRSGHAERLPDGTVAQKNWRPCAPCPPEVVSALLDVLDNGCDCPDYCNIRVAEATIARALEELKP